MILAAVGVTVVIATNRKDTTLEPEKPGVTDPERKPPTPVPPPVEQRLLTDVPAEPKAFLQWAAAAPSADISSEALVAVGRLKGAWTDEIVATALGATADRPGDVQLCARRASAGKHERIERLELLVQGIDPALERCDPLLLQAGNRAAALRSLRVRCRET